MPRLTINLGKIEQNARLISELLGPHGVGRFSASPRPAGAHELVAGAMLASGASALADSRASNIRNLPRISQDRDQFLRSPVSADDVGFDADIYFVSSVQQASRC